jgi:hypothetical protein
MAMKVEVTVADIVRSFAKGVIGERIAVRKLDKLMEMKYQEGMHAPITHDFSDSADTPWETEAGRAPQYTTWQEMEAGRADEPVDYSGFQEHVGGAPGQLNRFPDETIKIIEKNDDVYET